MQAHYAVRKTPPVHGIQLRFQQRAQRLDRELLQHVLRTVALHRELRGLLHSGHNGQRRLQLLKPSQGRVPVSGLRLELPLMGIVLDNGAALLAGLILAVLVAITQYDGG